MLNLPRLAVLICAASLAMATLALVPQPAIAHPIDEVRGQAVLEFHTHDRTAFDLTVLLRAAQVAEADQLLRAAGSATRDRAGLADQVRRAFVLDGCGTAAPNDRAGFEDIDGGAFVAVHARITCPHAQDAIALRRVSFRADRTRTTLFVIVHVGGSEVVRTLVPATAESATLRLDGSGGVVLQRGERPGPFKDGTVGRSPGDPVPVAGLPEPGSGTWWGRLRPPPIDLLGLWAREGALHLLFGIDHLLFLLTLVLASHRPRTLVYSVGTFSAGHLLTMGLALVVGWGPLRWLDMLIGATIAVSAWRARTTGAADRHPWRLVALAGAFGCVHGLGFGQGLRDLVGAVDATVLWPLASFGIGLDLAQLGWVALAGVGLATWRAALARRADGGALQARWQHRLALGLAAAGVVAGAVAVW